MMAETSGRQDCCSKLIAFYLPQYHPIPENDAWWGTGFTEWTNVAKGRPLFNGHYQPRVPADLGFYDLRLPEARAAQAELAMEYGIHGFCYYHYWFNGRRVLERPFNDVLVSGEPDFPFCLCWANENWTRSWDGGGDNILLRQQYDSDDDVAHIRSLLPALGDPRYIRVQGKPLLLVYRTEMLPDPQRTAELWRAESLKAGIGDLYLARVESFVGGIAPDSIGFDATVEFAPDWRNMGKSGLKQMLKNIFYRITRPGKGVHRQFIVEYDDFVEAMLRKKTPAYKHFRCVCPSFDNSPRRKNGAVILCNSTPEKYHEWLSAILQWTHDTHDKDEQLVFINAWNEWGEGNYLEPDQRWGRSYLEQTRRAVRYACGMESSW